MSQQYQPSDVAKAALVATQNGMESKTRSGRFSVAALWSMAAENDAEVEDELTHCKSSLIFSAKEVEGNEIENIFSVQTQLHFRKGQAQQEVAAQLEELETAEGHLPDDRKRKLYGNLFHLLQSEPRYIAGLTRFVTLSEIDTLLQTVMFTLFGNQYETREEYLLLSMFQNVLAAEFESATNFSNLMRANTPVSRMMTTYTRRGPGQTYLKSILSERVNKLIGLHDLDLEINPVKVYDQMVQDIENATNQPTNLPKSVSAEEAARNPDVQAIIAPRVKTLMEIGASFLSIIMSSIDQVPYGIRWICKQIRSLAKRKYPDSTEAQKCSLIGGFFMLRFVNPAIVTPQHYMTVDSDPKKNPRRTFTLVAKLLQNLANKPSHTKEPFMSVLNPFIEHNEARFQRFLNDLCEVGEFTDALEMEQYIALSKTDMQLKITLNEIYSTHSLLYNCMDKLCPEPDNRLRICLNDLGTPQPQLPRSENKQINLELFSRWDQTNIDTTSSAAADQLTRADYDAKSIFVQILRLSPNMAKMKPLDLDKIVELASTSRDQLLVRKGLKLGDMMQELIRLGQISKSDGYALLKEEISAELTHLGNLAEKVASEINSLSIVYKNIQDHNDYLRAQLETYKAYLQNVRIQSAPQQKAVKTQASVKFTHKKLEESRVIIESTVPENRRENIYFVISTPFPSVYVISLNYKGRDQPILEMDLKLDDLLEKQQLGVTMLDLDFVKFDVGRTIQLLNNTFSKK
ncbi:glyceraldehyde-3-phosphate dehydrogenase 1 [Boothiomyces sp. JEL0838]|nr:glyceraldehyde-3-phosphate dehydrogenase 1 [Boothiomyces sp. JEL0838]